MARASFRSINPQCKTLSADSCGGTIRQVPMTKKQCLGDFKAHGPVMLNMHLALKRVIYLNCYCLSVGNVTYTPLKLRAFLPRRL